MTALSLATLLRRFVVDEYDFIAIVGCQRHNLNEEEATLAGQCGSPLGLAHTMSPFLNFIICIIIRFIMEDKKVLKVGSVVWAKSRSDPPWPAMVMYG